MNRLSIVSKERIQEEILKGLDQAIDHGDYFYLLLSSNILSTIAPEFGKYEEIIHDKRGSHYEETLGRHTQDIVYRLNTTKSKLYLAVIFHDIGKVATIEKVGDKVRFVGHETVGAKITDKVLREYKFSNDVRTYVVKLIKYHMYINNLRHHSKRTITKALARLYIELGENAAFVQDLITLCEADTGEDFTDFRYIIDGFEMQPRVIRGADVEQYEPRVRGKLIQQMRFIQLTQTLNVNELRLRVNGEAKNILEHIHDKSTT